MYPIIAYNNHTISICHSCGSGSEKPYSIRPLRVAYINKSFSRSILFSNICMAPYIPFKRAASHDRGIA